MLAAATYLAPGVRQLAAVSFQTVSMCCRTAGAHTAPCPPLASRVRAQPAALSSAASALPFSPCWLLLALQALPTSCPSVGTCDYGDPPTWTLPTSGSLPVRLSFQL